MIIAAPPPEPSKSPQRHPQTLGRKRATQSTSSIATPSAGRQPCDGSYHRQTMIADCLHRSRSHPPGTPVTSSPSACWTTSTPSEAEHAGHGGRAGRSPSRAAHRRPADATCPSPSPPPRGTAASSSIIAGTSVLDIGGAQFRRAHSDAPHRLAALRIGLFHLYVGSHALKHPQQACARRVETHLFNTNLRIRRQAGHPPRRRPPS